MRRGTKRVSAFDSVVVAGGLLLVLLALWNLGPALAALRGEGTWGTFTARRVECVQHPGHEQCTWTGEFRAGRTVRHDVGFYGGDRDAFAPGQTVRAFDTGRRGHVYGPGGSNEWVVVVLLLAAGLGLACRPLTRRRGTASARGADASSAPAGPRGTPGTAGDGDAGEAPGGHRSSP
ncbi:hypothetical protein GCM10017673_11900 [Streptosporangium violaceochromogenes]|nr:hypothetical protein GCM10017673_11900 [Streptosporangium violaceochromogenes]